MQDQQIKRLAEDYLLLLKPISVSLDVVQRNTCCISEATEVWKNLQRDIENAGHSRVSNKL